LALPETGARGQASAIPDPLALALIGAFTWTAERSESIALIPITCELDDRTIGLACAAELLRGRFVGSSVASDLAIDRSKILEHHVAEARGSVEVSEVVGLATDLVEAQALGWREHRRIVRPRAAIGNRGNDGRRDPRVVADQRALVLRAAKFVEVRLAVVKVTIAADRLVQATGAASLVRSPTSSVGVVPLHRRSVKQCRRLPAANRAFVNA
jgi:hypothetical protein